MAYTEPRFATNDTQPSRFSNTANQNPYYAQYSAGTPPVVQTPSTPIDSILPNNLGQEQKPIPLSAHLSNFDTGAPTTRPQMLLVSWPLNELNKVKGQNFTKYQMKPDSLLYYFHIRQLQTIMATYPLDFPNDLREQMKKQLMSIRSRASFFVNLMFGCIGYSLLYRGKTWFKLTGNFSNRLLFMLFYLNCFWDTVSQENHYTLNQVFANNKIFEETVTKHNIVPSENFRIKLITES